MMRDILDLGSPGGGKLWRERENHLRAAPFFGTKKVPLGWSHGPSLPRCSWKTGEEGRLPLPVPVFTAMVLYATTLYFMLPRTEKRCDKQSSF